MIQSGVFQKRIGALAVALTCTLVGYVLPASGQLVPSPPGRFLHRLDAAFDLHPNPKFLACISNPNDDEGPTARVRVVNGELSDTLLLTLDHFKPGLAFDLFTVQRSNLLSAGTVNPAFTNFGLAWYQSDVQVNDDGKGQVVIRTILLNQIFGFDPDVTLPPTNTFHVGFWFNDPADAAPCGFVGFTPFNGEHHAGPLAMISVPDPVTNLGPLCTHPDDSTSPATCNP
jgi:hypothetical protein